MAYKTKMAIIGDGKVKKMMVNVRHLKLKPKDIVLIKAGKETYQLDRMSRPGKKPKLLSPP